MVGIGLQKARLAECFLQHWHRTGQPEQNCRIFTVVPDVAWQQLPSTQGCSLDLAASHAFARNCDADFFAKVEVALAVCPDTIAALVSANLWENVPFFETARVEMVRQSAWVDRQRRRRQHVLDEYGALFPEGAPTKQTLLVFWIMREHETCLKIGLAWCRGGCQLS